MPEAPEPGTPEATRAAAAPARERTGGAVALGLAFVVLGAFFLADEIWSGLPGLEVHLADRADRRRRRGPRSRPAMSSRAGLGLVLLVAGALWLLSVTDVLDLPYGVTIGVLLILVGVVIALTPGRHGLLTLVGILLVLGGIPALFVESDLWDEGIGDAVETPRTEDDLVPFEHGIGQLTVDLTSPGLPLDGQRVEARSGSATSSCSSRRTSTSPSTLVSAGNVEALGETENGFDVDLIGISSTSGTQGSTSTSRSASATCAWSSRS